MAFSRVKRSKYSFSRSILQSQFTFHACIRMARTPFKFWTILVDQLEPGFSFILFADGGVNSFLTEATGSSTSIKEDDGDLGEENSFWRCKADSVFCHPDGELPVEAIQGQKCLCCLIGSNSIALSDGSWSLFFPILQGKTALSTGGNLALTPPTSWVSTRFFSHTYQLQDHVKENLHRLELSLKHYFQQYPNLF